jgi:hypothetical protein
LKVFVAALFASLMSTALAQPASGRLSEGLDFQIRTTASLQAFLVGQFPDKAMPRLLRFSNGKRIGFMDLKGEIVIPPIFDGADFFLDGRVRVSRNKRWGFIDANGKLALEPKYEELGVLWAFPMPAKIDGRWGLIDATGEWLVKPAYEALQLHDDVISVKADGKWGLSDWTGRPLVAPAYDGITVFRNAGKCVVQVGRKSGLIDLNGKLLLEPEYDRIYVLADGYVILDKNGRSTLIRAERPAAPLLERDEIYPAHKRQLWIVKNQRLYGVVDSNGKQVIKQQYELIGTNGEDRFNVSLAGKSALADKEGRFLTPFEFDDILYLRHGLAAVRTGGKYGFIDASGKMVIEPRFDSTAGFDGELAAVSLNGKWGYIDRQGRFVIQPQFENAFSFHPDGIAVVKSQGRYIYVDRSLRRIADWMRFDVPTQEDFSLRP